MEPNWDESWKIISAVTIFSFLAYLSYSYFKRYQSKNGLIFDPLMDRFADLKNTGSDREAYELVDKLIAAPARQNLWFWYYQRYRFRLNDGDFQGALDDLTASLDLNPGKAELNLAKTELLFLLEDPERMKTEADKLLKAWPRLALTQVLCALAHIDDRSQAREFLTEGEKLLKDPKAVQPEADKSLLYFYYGFAYYLLDQRAKTEEYYELSHRLRPDNTYVLYGEALREYDSGNLNEAYIAIQRSIISGNRQLRALTLSGEIYLKLGKKSEAQDQLLRSARYGNRKAQTLLETGNFS